MADVSNVCNTTDENSPIMVFVYFHRAICNELNGLVEEALALQNGSLWKEQIQKLRKGYRFLRFICKHHSNAEDEVGALQSSSIY
ncbi:hypothetical protein SUGI_0016230 [Cryptomeria japonica]|nr:hypothetical protein SUGI_0016230 [Cryptomeria japonica]